MEMEKSGVKTRDIRFYSNKNNAMVCVHSQQARNYAKYLENADWVKSFHAGFALDKKLYAHVNPVGIRKQYFDIDWTSDFYIVRADGSKIVHELSTAASLSKLAEIEKLEFSRRYWAALDIAEWSVVIDKEDIP